MERATKTFLIPDDLCKRVGIAATFRPPNELSVFAFEKRSVLSKADVPSHFASNSPVSIHHLRQEVILFHPILRKLVNESNGVFVAVQNAMKAHSGSFRSQLLNFSIQYRSIIRACLEHLQQEISTCHEDTSRDELRNYVTIFYSIERVWHLCEILFVDDGAPGHLVLPQLLEWVRFHFPKHDRNAIMMLNDLVDIDSRPEYWDTVFGSLLQGRVNVARALLKHHSLSDTACFKQADQLLRAMPVCNSQTVSSTNEFSTQWRHWTIDVQAKLDTKVFNSDKNLSLIMRLLVGEEQAWLEVRNRFEAWYEFFAGWLFYTEPTVKPFELGHYAKRCITMMGLSNKLKHLDRVLLATMEFDLFQVIIEIQNMSESGWFVTHFTDLLWHSGLLDRELQNFSAEKLRECFVLEYGMLLMSHKSLWQSGLTYLDHCPNDGLQVIQLLLPRIYPENEAKTLKIIREAKSRDLTDLVHSICKTQGMISIRRKRLGNALYWAVKSQDSSFTSFLADKFLEGYIKSGELTNTDLLENLGSCMLVSDRLIFLGKYFEFHKLYKAGEYQEAANLLTSLLGSKIIPKYFWHVLLMEAIPLLESEDLLFSSNDTYTILHCIEEKGVDEKLGDTIDILRLAAARNLSRALTYENQLENLDIF